MGQRGPRPKPAALKLVAGQRGAVAARGRKPPVRKGCPIRPPELTGEAAAEWDRIAPELDAAGLLAVTDRGILTAYCCAVADMLAARDTINREGRFIRQPVQTSTGKVLGEIVREHPAVKMLSNASGRVHKLAAELALTPASRSRLEGADGGGFGGPANKVTEIRDRIAAARNGS